MINQTLGINPQKTAGLGENFHSIDFAFNDDYTADNYLNKSNKVPVGTFMIAGKSFKVTWSEIERIKETMSDAQEILQKRYKLGRMMKS